MLYNQRHLVSRSAEPESADQVRCMDCLTANGAVQLPTNRDIRPDRVFSAPHHGLRVPASEPAMELSQVRIYQPGLRMSQVIFVPMEVSRG